MHMPEMNETDKLADAIMNLIIADHRIAAGDPAAIANALAALSANLAGIMAGVFIAHGGDIGQAVKDRFMQRVDEGIADILHKAGEMAAAANETRH